MNQAEIQRAAERLGVEKDLHMKRFLKRTSIGAIVIGLVILLLYLYLRSINTYPCVRTTYVRPRNRFLAMIAIAVDTSEVCEYGVFSRRELAN
jgi:hypothetical protein